MIEKSLKDQLVETEREAKEWRELAERQKEYIESKDAAIEIAKADNDKLRAEVNAVGAQAAAKIRDYFIHEMTRAYAEIQIHGHGQNGNAMGVYLGGRINAAYYAVAALLNESDAALVAEGVAAAHKADIVKAFTSARERLAKRAAPTDPQ